MDNRAIHKFEIVKHIGKLSYINNGYTKELNFILKCYTNVVTVVANKI